MTRVGIPGLCLGYQGWGLGTQGRGWDTQEWGLSSLSSSNITMKLTCIPDSGFQLWEVRGGNWLSAAMLHGHVGEF